MVEIISCTAMHLETGPLPVQSYKPALLPMRPAGHKAIMPATRIANLDRLIPWLSVALLVAIALVGGASRADAFGQVLVRMICFAAACLILLLRTPIRMNSYLPVVILLALAMICIVMQLVPLPPGMWTALPGRATFAELGHLIGAESVWRPIAIVPDAALNAAFSLCVPVAMVMAFGVADVDAPARTLRWLTVVASLSALIALFQTAGGAFDNPFINQTPGEAAGLLANRNHQALLLAIGIVTAPAWLLSRRRPLAWRWAVTLGVIVWFLLMILATGSRAGLGLGAIALFLSVATNREVFAPAWRRLSPQVRIGAVVSLVGLLLGLVLLSIRADTAKSFDRLFALDASEDMRARAVPTIFEMIRTYFPFGSGAGSFDPVFRISEPFDFLHQSYFNHAHNDYLEIALTNGLPGILLIVAALGWWLRRSVAIWRPAGPIRMEAGGTRRLGSAVLLLILIASVTDYPARTPLMMAIVVAAACAMTAPGRSALPHGRNAI